MNLSDIHETEIGAVFLTLSSDAEAPFILSTYVPINKVMARIQCNSMAALERVCDVVLPGVKLKPQYSEKERVLCLLKGEKRGDCWEATSEPEEQMLQILMAYKRKKGTFLLLSPSGLSKRFEVSVGKKTV